jgi:hypothetical protein
MIVCLIQSIIKRKELIIMAVLPNGYSVTIKQKTGDTNTNIYPVTRSKNVITAAGHDLETLLDEIEGNDGSVVKAAVGTAGIVELSSSVTSNSETVAATSAAVKAVQDAVDALESAASNAYVLKTQLGVASVEDESTHEITTVGVATLDTSGKVPSTQLPSYVDDVIEGYLNNGSFYTTKTAGDPDPTYSGEITPETGKIYVDLDTNKTYRWGGSAYAVISETVALGRTASTAFPGDAGASLEAFAAGTATGTNRSATIVYQAFEANDPDDHSYTNNGKIYVKVGQDGTPELVEVYRRPWLNANSTADNPDGITASTIGLGNVENKSAATIISEITLADLVSTVGYASSSTGGLMRSTDKAKLDNTMEIAVSETAPSFANGIWVKIDEDETEVVTTGE